jgi:hypothetical protein
MLLLNELIKTENVHKFINTGKGKGKVFPSTGLGGP